MRIQANLKPSIIGWCLALSIVLVISVSPSAEAVSNNSINQIGSVCSHEMQAVPESPTKGGTLICLKDKSGLHWRDLLLVKADRYLDSILPSCIPRRFSPPIKVSADHFKIFTRLVTAYFDKQNLLPIKILQVNKVVKKFSTVGIHLCSNGVGAPLGAWGGFMPLNASEGWLVYTMHRKNGFGDSLFLYIVKTGISYKIVGGGTSP